MGGPQKIDFLPQNLQNISKLVPKIDAKFMKDRVCIADAFLERPFWPQGARARRVQRLLGATWAALNRLLGTAGRRGGSQNLTFLVPECAKASKNYVQNDAREKK